jgi:hypothetical protein
MLDDAAGRAGVLVGRHGAPDRMRRGWHSPLKSANSIAFEPPLKSPWPVLDFSTCLIAICSELIRLPRGP